MNSRSCSAIYDSVLRGGDVAEGLLQAASGSNTLIVVGNRGLGARRGETLGVLPEKVLKNASSDVILVQTGGGDATGSGRDEVG